jgi:hypothetical protein
MDIQMAGSKLNNQATGADAQGAWWAGYYFFSD